MEVQRQSDPIRRMFDSSQAVEDSVTYHGGPVVAEILEERFSPHNTVRIADGETEDGQPVFRVVMYKLRDELTASREGLVEVEERHIEIKRQITKVSNERMELFKELADDYTWLRGKLERQVGSHNADVLAGFQAPTAPSSTGLLRQVKLAADALSAPDLELPADRLGAFEFDPKATAEKLREKAKRYRKLLAELRKLKRQLDVSQKEKDRTVERHKKTFLSIARTLEDFYRLAGEDELAEKVRPSVVQRGRRAVEVEDSPDGGSDTTDGPADGAADGDPSPDAVTVSPVPDGRTPVDSGSDASTAADGTVPADAGSSDA